MRTGNMLVENDEETLQGLLKRMISMEEKIGRLEERVRELTELTERMAILSESILLKEENLPAEWMVQRHPQCSLSTFELASVEKLHIQRVLGYTKGNKVRAAKLLNIGLTTVYRKMEEYGLNED